MTLKAIKHWKLRGDNEGNTWMFNSLHPQSQKSRFIAVNSLCSLCNPSTYLLRCIVAVVKRKRLHCGHYYVWQQWWGKIALLLRIWYLNCLSAFKCFISSSASFCTSPTCIGWFDLISLVAEVIMDFTLIHPISAPNGEKKVSVCIIFSKNLKWTVLSHIVTFQKWNYLKIIYNIYNILYIYI